MSFDFAATRSQHNDLKRYRHPFIISPSQWSNFSAELVFTWDKVKFSRTNAVYVPDDLHGIYSFVAEPGIAGHPSIGYLLYVGKAERTSFRERYTSYVHEKQKSKPRPHIAHMIDLWGSHLWFYYAPIDGSKESIGSLEDNLINAIIPPFNDQWPAEIRPAMRMFR